MYRKGSFLLPILIVLFIISLSAAAGVFYLYQKEQTENVKLRGQIVELENLQRETASKLDESKKIATDLSLKLEEAKSKLDSLTGELAAEKSAHEQTTSKMEQLQGDLANQKSLREDLENQLNQSQDEGKQIKEQIKIMQQQKIALEEKIKNLESGVSGVELGTVVVNPESLQPVNNAALAQLGAGDNKTNASGARILKANTKEQLRAAKALEGKVMIVNKEFNFVVINLGSQDKINVGDEFLVSHSGKTIGVLKVEKVHEAMSAAGFAAELKDLIKENDKVTQKIK